MPDRACAGMTCSISSMCNKKFELMLTRRAKAYMAVPVRR